MYFLQLGLGTLVSWPLFAWWLPGGGLYPLLLQKYLSHLCCRLGFLPARYFLQTGQGLA